MRINRLELIEKIRVMINQREAEANARKVKAVDEAGRAEGEYVAEHSAEWTQFANRIRAQVRKSLPITLDDVPEGLRSGRGWHGEVRLFRPSTVRESDYVARTEPLTRLIAVLEASPDEFISTSALDRIGAPLRELMKP